MIQNCHNKALQDAFQYYQNFEQKLMDDLRSQGVKFAVRNSHCHEVKTLLSQLKAKGAKTYLSNASVKYGWVSQACFECSSIRTSTSTYTATLQCHRDCFYCIDYTRWQPKAGATHGIEYLTDKDALASKRKLKCAAITGGEPLLDLDTTYAMLSKLKELFPNVHTRLYTSGDLATVDVLKKLQKLGLQEIRFSIKYYDDPATLEKVFDNMKIATAYIPDVVVEMPIIPGEKQKLQRYMQRFDDIGIKGMNLLEMVFNIVNWSNFEQKGLLAKNPISPIPAYYGYCHGGIKSGPVAGSEQLALELMAWAIDQKFSFGMHYCSVENKFRGDVLSYNKDFINCQSAYDFDREDYFIKTAKVFGPDCEIAKPMLEQAGCKHFIYNNNQHSMAFERRYIPKLLKSSVTPLISYNIGVEDNGRRFLSEIALKEINSATNGQ